MGSHVVRMKEGRSAFKILTGKPTGKRPLGRPRRRWEGYIRTHLKEIGMNTRNWVDSAQYTLRGRGSAKCDKGGGGILNIVTSN